MALVPGVTFRTVDEARPGPKLAAIYAQRAAPYATWYLQEIGRASCRERVL